MTRLRATIGLDIGGTKISGCVINSNGLVLARGRKDTPAQDPAAIVSESADLIRELSFQREIDAVGVACAGFIDQTGSTVLFAPNLAWRDLPPVSYTHLRAHETVLDLVCRLLLEKKK